MHIIKKILIGFSLALLAGSLLLGVIAGVAFFAPNRMADLISFRQLRPFHVSAALFWILTAAVSGILVYKNDFSKKLNARWTYLFGITWMLAIVAVFLAYAFQLYGGREYWEFPPLLNIFLLLAWVFLLVNFFQTIFRLRVRMPVYLWMWTAGILFFLFTFIEQNLWQIPWFRQTFLREVTIQWKSNGSMVGAWNQLIYGTAIYLMVKISGDESIGRSKLAFGTFFLGLANLIFNWGHHIYNVPANAWIRDIAYAISMSEWVLVILIIRGFARKLEERKKFRHLVPYRFLIASEFWIFLNLLLALLMSVPAINRYTHGTHVTVAHAMGTTIGINTMILLASISYLLGFTSESYHRTWSRFNLSYWTVQASLVVFWLALIAAGLIKGLRMANEPNASFSEVMGAVFPVLQVFLYSGIVLAAGLLTITAILLQKWYQSLLSHHSVHRIPPENSLVTSPAMPDQG